MAKFGLNPAFEFVSGKLGKYLVTEKVTHILKVGGLSAAGVFRRLGDHASYGQTLQNVREAWKIVANTWTTVITAVEKQTWKDEAATLITQGYVVKSGYQLFIAECMALYGSQYGGGVFPTAIGNGATSWNYSDLSNFVWTD